MASPIASMLTTKCHCHLNLTVASASPSRFVVFLLCHQSQSLLPLNAGKCCHCDQMTLPLPPLNDPDPKLVLCTNVPSTVIWPTTLLLMTIVDHFPQVVLTSANTRPLLLLLLVGCCIVVHCPHPFLSLHAVMRLPTLSFPAAFDVNCQSLPSDGLNTSHCLLSAAPVIGWLLHFCPPLPLAFVLSCHRETVKTLFANHLLLQIVDRRPPMVWSPITACLCCSHCCCHCLVIVHSCCCQTALPISTIP
jgi:hypothetical protein